MCIHLTLNDRVSYHRVKLYEVVDNTTLNVSQYYSGFSNTLQTKYALVVQKTEKSVPYIILMLRVGELGAEVIRSKQTSVRSYDDYTMSRS